ncbi:MAG: RDD family protein [Nanoarchaeota archaeon]|nr:RDD family protein [Nanoarchaeota archaeon]
MDNIGVKKGKTILAQASILKRAAAFFIDLVIINMVILFPFRSIFDKIIPETDSFSKTLDFLSNNADSTSITVIILLISAISILYFVILEKKLNQSVGKMLFNLYVNSQTKDLKYWQLFVRSIFLIPMFPFVLLWIIDPIVMFFTKENQRLSEILSQTKVVGKYKV